MILDRGRRGGGYKRFFKWLSSLQRDLPDVGGTHVLMERLFRRGGGVKKRGINGNDYRIREILFGDIGRRT